MKKSQTLRLPSYIPSTPSPKQIAFLLAPQNEVFYGGAAGGGKSEALLMGALQYVDHPNYAAIILRRSYTDLAQPGGLMDRARGWLYDTPAKWDREKHTWHFPSGAQLAFGYIATDQDRFRYQGGEYQYVAFDEVTDFPTDSAYLFLFSRMRRKSGMEDIPLRMRCAANPIGPGVHWVKKRFVEERADDRIFIPAKFTENPYIDQESYRKALSNLHPSLQEALIEGNWEMVEDAAFPEFNPEVHVIDPIQVPREWRRWEAMDFGVSNPTAWLAAALSPPPEPFAILHSEYYRPGLISDHASKILTLRSLSWGEPLLAVCDPSIRARTGFGQSGAGQTVHSEFADNGIHLVPANNDRLAGRVRVSELLRQRPEVEFPAWHPRAGDYGAPILFISRTCTNTIEQVRDAPIDTVQGELVDYAWETRRGHAMAALRYLATARIFPQVSNPSLTGIEGNRSFRRDWNQSWKNWERI